MQDNNDIFKRPEERTEEQPDKKEISEEASNEQFKTKIFSKVTEESDKKETSDDYKTDKDVFESEEESGQVVKNHKNNPKKRKQRKRIPAIVKVLILFGISIALAAVIILTAIDVLGIAFKNDFTAEVYIQQGYSTEQIAAELHDKGIINNELLFRLFSKIQGADGKYQFGMYELKDSQSFDSLISALQQPGESGEIVSVTVPEGYSVLKIAALMEDKGVCTKDEFISAVKNSEFDYDFIKDIPTEKVKYKLEGYLYPDTYQLFVNSDGKSGEECAARAVRKMVERMNDIITEDVISTAEKKGYSLHEILTMASILELEASGYPNEMAKVAQVFYNRLRWTDQPNMLGSTPTADYSDSRYDTNKIEGLPPGPLCSPSKVAIEAALSPDTSVKEDYFVTDKNMKFYYTSSYDEHMALISDLKSQGLWAE